MADDPYQEPLIIVSADAHVGPRPKADLRSYCERAFLEDFDEFAAQPIVDTHLGISSDAWVEGQKWNSQTDGHWDPHAHLADMDRDGIAATVIYHDSLNYQPFPLDPMNRFGHGIPSAADRERVAAGRRIYNRWLADFCSVAPDRFVGLAQLPMWDVETAIKELEAAAASGLKGVNFPAPSALGLPLPDAPEFEDFYAAAASLGMTLSTHVGVAPPVNRMGGQHGVGSALMDTVQWGRRAMWMLTFAGVFERHPDLKLVIAEHPGSFWGYLIQEMDSVYHSSLAKLSTTLPRLPSEYVKSNVWVGNSFASRAEAEVAVDGGISERICWGSDYPHPEGTWCYAEDPDEVPMTWLSLGTTFHDLPLATVREMIGGNTLAAYPLLDRDAVTDIGRRIGPTPAQILHEPDLTRIEKVPHNMDCSLGFRTIGGWA